MTTQISKVIQHLRSTLLVRDGADLTDGELLECFVSRKQTAAIEALVRRHGPMVWGVCRRILRNHHDAEDAFQATFLVLVRKAASVTPREMVGNWLYGVAQQTALKARATAAKQRTRERQVGDMRDPVVKEQDLSGALQFVLDQELNRLPDKYRVAIVLCDLEGETRKEAARQLGLPEGTLAGRLTRGRAMLAKRLARHGLAVTGGTLAAWLSQTAVSASVPTSVLSSTVKAVTLVAAGKTAASGLVSAKVATLTEGVVKAMMISKLKSVVAVVLMLGFIATGATVLSCRTAAAQGDQPLIAEEQPALERKLEPDREKVGLTAWGKEVGGLQAGLGYRPGEKRAYGPGETVKLVVRVRNVGKEEVKFQYLKEFFIETPPAVTDGDGKPVPLGRRDAGGLVHVPAEVNLAPGKEIELAELKLEPRSGAQSAHPGQWNLWGTGKFSVQYERLARPDIDKILSKLATGKLELVIRFTSEPPATPEKKAPPKQVPEDAFTAWGKEVGSLQAGLGYLPGQKRAYSHGETVKLVVRVRNVGKEAVKFEYLKQFFIETPPAVTDRVGKPVVQDGTNADGLGHHPTEVNLAPGKEIELYELKRELSPANEIGNEHFSKLYGTGKVRVHFDRVFGLSSLSGRFKVDPALSKLATGKLELEIKAAPPTATESEASQKQERDDKRFTMEFDKAQWKGVFEWYADQTGLPYVSALPAPPGTFSHSTPKGRTYTVHEITVLINDSLIKQDHVLVPRKECTILVKIAK
jgi:RNA polymerase sigma factor (sigma-70 family)